VGAGIVAGFLLGLAHWRMFLRNIQALHPADTGKVKLLARLTAGLRVALTAALGFILVVHFRVDAYGLAAGLLASTYVFRVWAWQRAQGGTGLT
jgi:hypothetical protein